MNKKQIFIVSFVSLALIIILSTTSNVTTKPKVNLKNVKDHNAASNCTNDKAYYGCKPSGGDDCGSPQSTIGTQQNACICNGNGTVNKDGECKCADGWGGVLCQHCDGDHYNPGGASSKSPPGSYGINPDIDLKCVKKVPNCPKCAGSITWRDTDYVLADCKFNDDNQSVCTCLGPDGSPSSAETWGDASIKGVTGRWQQQSVDTIGNDNLNKCGVCMPDGDDYDGLYDFREDTCMEGSGNFGCCSGTCSDGVCGCKCDSDCSSNHYCDGSTCKPRDGGRSDNGSGKCTTGGGWSEHYWNDGDCCHSGSVWDQCPDNQSTC